MLEKEETLDEGDNNGLDDLLLALLTTIIPTTQRINIIQLTPIATANETSMIVSVLYVLLCGRGVPMYSNRYLGIKSI